MIVMFFYSTSLAIVNAFIGLVPDIQLEIDGTQQLFYDYTNMIMNNLGLIDLIAPLGILKTCLVATLTLLIGKWTWGFIMFILRKIPFASIR